MLFSQRAALTALTVPLHRSDTHRPHTSMDNALHAAQPAAPESSSVHSGRAQERRQLHDMLAKIEEKRSLMTDAQWLAVCDAFQASYNLIGGDGSGDENGEEGEEGEGQSE